MVQLTIGGRPRRSSIGPHRIWFLHGLSFIHRALTLSNVSSRRNGRARSTFSFERISRTDSTYYFARPQRFSLLTAKSLRSRLVPRPFPLEDQALRIPLQYTSSDPRSLQAQTSECERSFYELRSDNKKQFEMEPRRS